MWDYSYNKNVEGRRVPSTYMGRPVAWIASALLFAWTLPPARAADADTPEAVKAAFLYRFASYVEWPADAAAPGTFTIGVAGSEGVTRQLESMLPRLTVRGSRAVVRRVARNADLAGVRILYVGDGALASTHALRAAALQQPILIVTDDPQGLDGGGVINFVEAEGNVRFEVSLIAADRARLTIDSALLSVAARVERRPAFDETQQD